MKKIKLILPYISAILLTYLSFSFALWQSNPELWKQETRIVFILALTIILGIMGFINILNSDNIINDNSTSCRIG